MPALQALEESIDLMNRQNVRNTAHLRLADSIKLNVSHSSSGKASRSFAIELSGANWSLRHETGTQDTELRLRRRLKSGTLELSQLVPGNFWFMVPTPCVQWAQRRSGTGRLQGILQGRHDFLHRSSRLSETVYWGPDHRHKCGLQWDSMQGATAVARTKLRSQALHSVAVSLNSFAGAVLSLKSRPSQHLKLRLQGCPSLQQVAATVTYHPQSTPADPKAKVVLYLVQTGPQFSPKAVARVKWDF